MNDIQEIYKTKENLNGAVKLCVDDLGTWFTMQSKDIQFKILKVIGKYHNLKLQDK